MGSKPDGTAATAGFGPYTEAGPDRIQDFFDKIAPPARRPPVLSFAPSGKLADLARIALATVAAFP